MWSTCKEKYRLCVNISRPCACAWDLFSPSPYVQLPWRRRHIAIDGALGNKVYLKHFWAEPPQCPPQTDRGQVSVVTSCRGMEVGGEAWPLFLLSICLSVSLTGGEGNHPRAPTDVEPQRLTPPWLQTLPLNRRRWTRPKLQPCQAPIQMAQAPLVSSRFWLTGSCSGTVQPPPPPPHQDTKVLDAPSCRFDTGCLRTLLRAHEATGLFFFFFFILPCRLVAVKTSRQLRDEWPSYGAAHIDAAGLRVGGWCPISPRESLKTFKSSNLQNSPCVWWFCKRAVKA